MIKLRLTKTLRIFNWFVFTSLIVVFSGCSMFGAGDKKPVPKPYPTLSKRQVVTERIWERQIGEGQADLWQQLQLAIDGGVIYSVDHKGNLVAINKKNGKTVWKRRLPEFITAGVKVADGTLYLGTISGKLIAVDENGGSKKWDAQVSSEILALPTVTSDIVVVKTIDDKLHGIDVLTGEKLWTQSVLQPALTLRGSSAPISEGEVVFAGFANGEVRAYHVTDGTQLWVSRIAIPKGSSELERMVDIVSTPVLNRSGLFVASLQGNTVALDPPSGQLQWAKEFSSYNSLTSGYSALYLTDDNDVLASIDIRTGSVLWRQSDLKLRHLGSPAIWKRYVVVGDGDGYLHFATQMDGQLVGRTKVGSYPILVKPVIDGDVAYVFAQNGQLVAYKLHERGEYGGKKKKIR